MSPLIVPIVEGHGEVSAVPILLRRIAADAGTHNLIVAHPIRCPRNKLLKAGELERSLELAIQKATGNYGILILIDAETDCPRELGPVLLERARHTREGVALEVVLANKEYEAWFLGAIESISEGAIQHPHEFEPERIQGAKERLAEVLGCHYSETVDQPALSAVFDLNAARQRCPSFDKCYRSVESLLAQIGERQESQES